MKSCRFYIYGLDCPACALKVEEGLAKDPRIKTANVDYSSKRIELSCKESLGKDDVQAIVDRYEDGCRIEEAKKEDEEGKRFRVKLITIGVRALVSLVLAIIGTTILGEANVGLGWNLAVMLTAYLISSYDIFYKAALDIVKHRNFFDENVLMSIATIGAFCMRAFGPEHNEFFEGVMVVVLYQIGELFETFASGRSHKAILDAVGLKAKTARRINGDGSVSELSPEAIVPGDNLEIRVGDLLPVDGEVIDGTGSVDESSLTGEFMPVEAAKGSLVKAGTLLKSGSLSVKATAAYRDSSVAKILEMVESGSAKKSKVDKFINKFSRVYTPVVIALALLLAVLPPLFTGYNDPLVWERWIYTALSALVISCPCAIVISVPLSYFAGIGLASRHGVVIKGSNNFDTLNSLSALCVDKTGTLTEGRFKVEKKVSEIGEKDFDTFIKAAEARSSHPIAEGILGGEDASVYGKDITEFDEVAGHGTKAVYKGHALLAGNAAFLADNGIRSPEVAEMGTIVHLAVDSKYAGYVLLDDAVREESVKLVDGMHALGKKVYLLTGDREKAASKVACKLGLDGYRAGLLPEDKRSLLESYSRDSHGSVGYLGDGINDAPCIATADIGFAMGGIGSDLAIENADAIIMNDDPSKVVTAVKAARKTRNKAIANIVAALVVKAVFLVLSVAIANFPLYIAVLADTGLTAILVVNALLLLRAKVE